MTINVAKGILMKHQQLDAKGLLCPLPVLKARKLLKAMGVGDCLHILATDPGSQQDFKAFCDTHGHELLESKVDGDVFSYLIKKII